MIATYAVGFGLPTTPISNGSATQSGTLPATPTCQVGGVSASVSAGLIGPGLYQLNITIPHATSNGQPSVICTYSGSNTASGSVIAVQK